VRTGNAVSSDDLTLDRERWPLFVPTALDAGFRSVAAVPMRLRDQTIGGLNMFNARPEPMPDEDRRLAQALADVATIGILQRRSTHRSNVLAEQLQHALNSRIAIEQAKGVLAERSNISMDEAFGALRGHARTQNLKLTDVALAVIRGELDIGGLPGA
jgi:GAF domain-containing protein